MVFSICPRISSAAAYRRWWTNNLSWNIVASVPQVGDKKQKQQRLPKKRERKLVFVCLFKKRQTPTYSEHQPNSLWTVKKPLCYLRFGPFKIGAYTECASRSHIFGSYNSKIQTTSRLKQYRKKSNIKVRLNSFALNTLGFTLMKPFNMRNIEGSYIEIIKKAWLYFHICRFTKGITGWRWNVPYSHWSLPTKKEKSSRMLLVWRSKTWTGSCFVCNRFFLWTSV